MDQKARTQRGLVEMILAMIICGTIGATVMLSGQSEENLIFFRCLFGTAVLGVACLFKGYFSKQYINTRFLIIALLGGLTLLLNWYFLFAAYSRTSITKQTVNNPTISYRRNLEIP